eukprot:482817-Amphidinium_carterae.1
MHESGSETAEGFGKSKDCLVASWPLVACIPNDSWCSCWRGVLCCGLGQKSIGVVCDVACLVPEIYEPTDMTETPKAKKAMDTKWKDSKVSQTGVKNKAVLTESELHEKTRRAIVE